jgi:CheY-like chemotaxis protein
VLVVEDEEALRTGIRRLLHGEGYTILEAENGAAAL